MNNELPEVLTIKQLARLLQMHPEIVRRKAKSGQIPARKAGKQWRFSKPAIMKWLEGPQAQSLDKAQRKEM